MSLASNIIQGIEDLGNFLLDVLLYVPKKVWSELLEALASVIEVIPAPEAVSVWNAQAANAFAGAGFFVNLAALDVGITLVGSALLARFLLRRIPFIG
ncbi:MAG: DUF2523 family protein [Panacagrimonas sp.]